MVKYIIWCLIISFLLIGCGEEEKPMNPYDPEVSKYYMRPQIEIVKGPKEGDVIGTDHVIFELSGKDSKIDYRYQLDGEGWPKTWTEIAKQNIIELELLDERSYKIEFQSNYLQRGEKYFEPKEVNFIVDTVKGPALMIKRKLTKVKQGDNFSVELMAEEVSDLMLIHVFLNYDTSMVKIEKVIEQRKFLEQNKGKIVFFENSSELGQVEISAGVGAGEPSGVNGTGSIAQITFTTLKAGETEIEINDASELRNSSNRKINIINNVKQLSEEEKKKLNGTVQIL